MAQLTNENPIGDIDMVKSKISYSPPFDVNKDGSRKKQSSIRTKKTGNKEEIFYTGGEKGGPKGFGKKGKVTTKVTPAGRKTQTVEGKSLKGKLKRTVGEKITGTGKDKAAKLKGKHLFGILAPGPKLKKGGSVKKRAKRMGGGMMKKRMKRGGRAK